ncbi:hypothetical protein N7520_011088 [Penicillium odoratum]|uniref:uncharacterized protein n=1 Tax=Penicillium odoratum TaxID=1167516 RepID=UPI0025477099|nr:uncharacterized protein N7520_011088 [Penicillium odoratum]KAJ5745906.1 hypothetical protein N7520_011088 [Penicillium odoratum]
MPPRKLPKGYVEVEESPFKPLVPHNPYLPAIPIKASFGYGSQFGTTMPRRLPPPPRQNINNLKQIAESVNHALENSQLRATAEMNAQKSTKKMPEKAKPAPKKRQPAESQRRSKREPTPDEIQLQQALREATLSPRKEDIYHQSDSTPSPPVQRTVSTDSSPGAEPPLPRRLSVMSSSPLYPSPLQRGGHETYETNSSGRWSRQSSVDNASVVSWNLERDIHDDDLKRTRPSTHGRNITAPPRRPSGLSSILHSTIEEEDETNEEEQNDGDADGGDELISEHSNLHESVPEGPTNDPTTPATEGWTTSVRTIIPQLFQSAPSRLETPDLGSRSRDLARAWYSPVRPEIRDAYPKKSKRTKWGYVVIMLLLPVALALSFQMGLWEKLRFPEFPSPIQYSPNATDSAAVHGLKNQVSKMNEQMSSLSRDLVAVRSQHAPDSNPTFIVGPPAGFESPIHKINFLSPSLGAIVDPHQTTPTTSRSYPFYQRVVFTMLGLRSTLSPSLPPVAALTPWEEVGDCWCSAPRNGVSQISVLLGRDIVPEEVVVEHIPSGATLDPGTAPREIEIWARYRIIALPSHESSSFLSRWMSRQSTPNRPIEPVSSRKEGLGGYTIPGEDSLHEVLMNSLSATNIYDPETAYSDDPLLGPNFYRVGKMVYDINKHNHIQRFHLNTIIDIPTIRVDKVAFRVKSNWGSNNTCIYRFKLHGHI